MSPDLLTAGVYIYLWFAAATFCHLVHIHIGLGKVRRVGLKQALLIIILAVLWPRYYWIVWKQNKAR